MFLAFTGHRPKDLPSEYQGYAARNTLVFEHVTHLFKALHEKGRNVQGIHVGGALGIDTAVALDFGATMLQSHLHLPFTVPVMTARWREFDRETLEAMVAGELGTFHLCESCPQTTFSWDAYQRRNEHMINRSDLLVAFWTGKRSGGTWNAIQYAHKVKKPVVNIIDGHIRIIKP